MKNKIVVITLGLLIVVSIGLNIGQYKNNNDLKVQIELLQNELDSMKENINSLDTEISAKNEEISTLEKKISDLENEIATLTADNESLVAQIEELTATKSDLEKQLEEIGATYTEPETTPETPKETPNPSSTIVDEPQIGEVDGDGAVYVGGGAGLEEMLPEENLPDWW